MAGIEVVGALQLSSRFGSFSMCCDFVLRDLCGCSTAMERIIGLVLFLCMIPCPRLAVLPLSFLLFPSHVLKIIRRPVMRDGGAVVDDARSIMILAK